MFKLKKTALLTGCLIVFAIISLPSSVSAAKATFFFSCPAGKGDLSLQDDASRPFVTCAVDSNGDGVTEYSTPTTHAGTTGATGIKAVDVECPGSEAPAESQRRFSCPTGPKPTVSIRDSQSGEQETPPPNAATIKTDCKDPALDASNCKIVDYLRKFINALSAIVGIVIVIMIIVGGIQYSAAGANPQATQAAKGRITTAITALIIYIFTFAFLQWIVPGGIF